MYIVFGDENLEMLKERYTVLELETFNVDGVDKTAYCVLTPDTIPVGSIPELERFLRLHDHLIENYNSGNYEQVKISLEHLNKQLGPDMDSFYEIIAAKIAEKEQENSEN